VNTVSHSVENPPGAVAVGENACWSDSPHYLPEISFQDVDSADLFIGVFGESVVMEAVMEVLLHKPHRPLGFHLVFSPPRFEALDGFPAAWSVEDIFGLGNREFQVNYLFCATYIVTSLHYNM
jgi:hypothetical protein